MSVTISGSGTISGLAATGISDQPVFAGNVLQVIQAQSTAATTTSSTSYVDLTGMSASITVKANSKVFIMVTCGTYGAGSGSAWGATGNIAITDSANTILIDTEHIGTITNEAQTAQHATFVLTGGLSAGTYTYKVRGRSITGGSIEFNRPGSSSKGRLILMEIAG